MIVLNDVLKGKHSVAIGGHIRPDGDCVGSTIGLYLYLTTYYPEIETDLYLEEIPEAFQMMGHWDVPKHEIVEGKVYDLFISLDCGDERRLGFSEPMFQNAKETLCVDHHVSNESFADTNYIVPDASSTSELVFRLLDEEKITEEIASFLYMGIVHDTGVFQYSSTSPETMEVGAALLRKGINGSAIIDGTYFEKSYVQNQMLGKALLESMMILNKKAVVSVIRLKEMEFFQAKPSDLDGIVSVLRQTRGVEVAILLYELEPQTFKVSLRSKEIVDVSAVAKYYGGGGHVRAAGVTMKGSPHDVINNLTLLIERQLRVAEEKNEEK